jgi:hypothetical protein
MSRAATGGRDPLGVAILVALTVAASSVARPGTLRAQARPAPDRGVPAGGGDGNVEITVVGTADDLRRIRGVVDSRNLAGPGAQWSHVPHFDPMDILRGERETQHTALRCWIDVVDPRRARLYFAARSGQQFLVRDVEMAGAFDDVDRETLSQVLELSVAALLEDQRAGLTRAQVQAVLSGREPDALKPAGPPEPSPPPPDLVQSPRLPRHFGTGPMASVIYGARVLGGDLPLVHGPGALLSWTGLGASRGLGVWASGQYQLPQQEVGPAIGLRFETVAARGGVQGHLPFRRGSATRGDVVGHGVAFAGVTGRLGAGADMVRVTPRAGSADPSAVLTPARWSRSLVVGAAVACNWTLGRRVALGATASVDVLPTAVHYDLDVDGRTAAAFSPWRVRPGLAMELSWY